MGISGFQRQRRLAALAQQKPPGSVAKLNYTAAAEVVAAAQPGEASSPLLDRLNKAVSADELTDLPTIGKGAATLILEARPEGGFESLESAIALTERVTKRPFRVDWDTVKTSLML